MRAEIWIVIVSSIAATSLMIFLAYPLLRHLQLVDVPNHRSSHQETTLRGGGIAPLAGFIVGCSIALIINFSLYKTIICIMLTAIAVAIVGFLEDFKGLAIRTRLAAQLIAGLIAGAYFSFFFHQHWLWIPISVFVFAAYVNFTNFMDGINGISSLHGGVVGIFFFAIGLFEGIEWLQVMGVIIAGVFLIFLPANLLPPGMFLGDVGSYLLGSAIIVTALGAHAEGVGLFQIFAPLSIYFLDTLFTIVRRAIRGKSVFEAHRSHIYQRLTGSGLNHLTVSLVVSLFTICVSTLGILHGRGILSPFVSSAVMLILLLLYVCLPKIMGVSSVHERPRTLQEIEKPLRIARREDWSPKRWIVLGATGFIGTAVSKKLENLGYEVIEVSAPRLLLDPEETSALLVAERAKKLKVTLELSQLMEGADVVINAAGLASPDGIEGGEMFGANALLPAVIVEAAKRSKVGRVIHLSSAAVQGRQPTLDTSLEVAPFSMYSRSKALGERSALLASYTPKQFGFDLIVVRATSVQGENRNTTINLRKIARSPLASVAAPGTQPTVVSSLPGLVQFIIEVGRKAEEMDPILLQPWEGLSAREVLTLAGGKPPLVLPRIICQILIKCGFWLAVLVPRLQGPVRRVELMWFGQKQKSPRADSGRPDSSQIAAILRGGNLNARD